MADDRVVRYFLILKTQKMKSSGQSYEQIEQYLHITKSWKFSDIYCLHFIALSCSAASYLTPHFAFCACVLQWEPDYGSLPGDQQATPSLPSSAGQGKGENMTEKKPLGPRQRQTNTAKEKACVKPKENTRFILYFLSAGDFQPPPPFSQLLLLNSPVWYGIFLCSLSQLSRICLLPRSCPPSPHWRGGNVGEAALVLSEHQGV